ncbi:fimbrial protein [Atlantibacter sp.]|uniref:fimbrial protein n=1 Tax=Atlantibacter sp. TaxID=1903473 RepID=UPI0028A7F47A|nr:fimbrial protein [Atlantibacter sp.]
MTTFYRNLMPGTVLWCVGGFLHADAFNSMDNIAFTVTGNIVNAVCHVDAPSTVELGTWRRQDLAEGGSDAVAVELRLTECAAGFTEATASFTGIPYDNGAWAKSLYANNRDDGAQDLGLQLVNGDGNPPVNLANGAHYTFALDSQSKSGQLTLLARLISPGGAPTVGAFSSAVTINFSYK